jgi:hypothetical protein
MKIPAPNSLTNWNKTYKVDIDKNHMIDFCIAISLYWNGRENSLPCLEDIRDRAKEEYYKFLETEYLYIDEYIY